MRISTDSTKLDLPDVPAVIARATGIVILTPDGEIIELDAAKAAPIVTKSHPIVCHGKSMANLINVNVFSCFDVLELLAFVHPTRFCVPTPNGLAQALQLQKPTSASEEAFILISSVKHLLNHLKDLADDQRYMASSIAMTMSRGGWSWGPLVLRALGTNPGEFEQIEEISGLRVWTSLPKHEEKPTTIPASNEAVMEEEALARLRILLGPSSEKRPQQELYTSHIIEAFQAHGNNNQPTLVLAEAGTGTGKTLGYIAPASLWAEKNGSAVWISTFTRNLQRQLDQELNSLYPDPKTRSEQVVIRKGRENYICLLNYEEAINHMAQNYDDAIALGMVARWLLYTRDGDISGGDFPTWLGNLIGQEKTSNLTDRRGECIYSACTHYQRCFIERTAHKAQHAKIVIANHALVMAQAALNSLEESMQPTRYIFDEGHHIFEAADSAFSEHLGGFETADLRQWMLGGDPHRHTRARGLRARFEDIVRKCNNASDLSDALNKLLSAARALPATGWWNRIAANTPHGPAERFLHLVRQQVYERADVASPYNLQTETLEPIEGLLEAASMLEIALGNIEKPMRKLVDCFKLNIDDEALSMDLATRVRIDVLNKGVEKRGIQRLTAWRRMLDSLKKQTPEEFVDWFGVSRYDGRDTDVGLHRHWIDPTLPFARTLGDRAHGLVVTSATLVHGEGKQPEDWAAAELWSGAAHLSGPTIHSSLSSPFDYAKQTRVFLITDVDRSNGDQVAAAYRDLFQASNGGGLGIFTAIARLKDVYGKIGDALAKSDIPLYAQHAGGVDTATLVDIFRSEEKSCLLGTDAVRDGVDVPGHALRLIVFDRVPWPRPDILHKARRNSFGKRTYDDMLARLRLKQAFGRLVRRASDRGVFVILDPMMPTRLTGAFPAEVEIERTGLDKAVEKIRAFVSAEILVSSRH